MTTILIVVAVLILLAFFILAAIKRPTNASGLPYQQQKTLLSPAERSFFTALTQAVADDGIVFSKVRVADVLTPKKGLDRSNWQKAFNAVAHKHFDFVICKPTDMTILACVELDDASHDSKKRKTRDDFLNSACESAGLPLMRVRAARGYVVQDIRQQFHQTIGVSGPETIEPSEVAPVNTTPTATLVTDASAEEPSVASELSAEHESPSCPKCGAEMIKRLTKKGDNAGQEFWGCSTFPKCRTMVPL